MPVPIVDLNDRRFRADRYGYIAELRAKAAYARTPDGAVVFLDQADVMEVLRCVDFRFAFNRIDAKKSPYLARAIEHELLNMHGDAHRRLSRLLKKALRDRVIEGMRQKIAGIVDHLVNGLPVDGAVDFCSAFADPLPARVLGPVFGIAYEQAEGLNDWIRIGGRKIDALQSGVGIAEVEDANRRIHDYLRDLLAQRRGSPGDDLFSEMMQVEIDGDRIGAEELVFLSGELASAGVDTTRAQLPLILNAFLDHPAEWDKLRADPGLAGRAVDEGMRFAPLPWVIPHRATRDMTYRDIEFAEGDLVFVMVPAANRDPAATERPDEFIIDRPPARHFAFGAGMHSCPGAHLAKMELSMALLGLLEACADIQQAAQPEWEPGQEGRTLRRLDITIRKTKPSHR
ncbi:MAG: cytochrome P450 [Pseudomonadota bacterium]|nr:cytochrome P450 [Pseudomonadota bacterium]